MHDFCLKFKSVNGIFVDIKATILKHKIYFDLC